MKKGVIIGVIILLISIGATFAWYFTSLNKVSNDSTPIDFTIEKGTSSKKVINDLYDAGLIKSKMASLIYVKLNKINIKASIYTLNKSMSTQEILNLFHNCSTSNNTLSITFVEGKRLEEYITTIASTYNWDKEELLKKINDKDYLRSLINKYWFLDESILNEDIYYALEGYLYPDTYEFYKDTEFTSIIEKMLDQMGAKLNDLKAQITEKDLSIHDLLTISSIVEKEAITDIDRSKVSQVIYKRLNLKMNLGMDVTTYYGAKKDLKETLTIADINNVNPYNTRSNVVIGLPIGPICSPSLNSLKASLNPADTDYTYFFADIKTGIIYFTDNYEEFLNYKKNFS